jgi:hypothetical protein
MAHAQVFAAGLCAWPSMLRCGQADASACSQAWCVQLLQLPFLHAVVYAFHSAIMQTINISVKSTLSILHIFHLTFNAKDGTETSATVRLQCNVCCACSAFTLLGV